MSSDIPPPSVNGKVEASLSTCITDIQSYYNCECSIQSEEWCFVEQCNESVSEKVSKLNVKANDAVKIVEETQIHLERLPDYFAKVDELEIHLDALEVVVKGLDEYSKALEKRFIKAEVSPQGRHPQKV